jgi:hypothetical protein
VHPYSRWASPAGQRLLDALPRHSGDSADDRTHLTRVAVRGVHAVGEPDLHFTHGEPPRGPDTERHG